MPLVKHELFTLLEFIHHFNGVLVSQSLVSLCVVFCLFVHHLVLDFNRYKTLTFQEALLTSPVLISLDQLDRYHHSKQPSQVLIQVTVSNDSEIVYTRLYRDI